MLKWIIIVAVGLVVVITTILSDFEDDDLR